MKPTKLSYTPEDDDTDGIANDVTALEGVALTLASDGPGDGLAHLIIITPSGSISDDFVITGTDADGVVQTETLASNTTSAVTSVKYYKTVTEVLAATLGAETVDIGWTDDIVSPTFPLNWRQQDFHVSLGVDVSGTIDYTVQHTFDPLHPQEHNVADPAPSTFKWWPHASLVTKTADTDGDYDFPVTATRLLINSLTAGATITFHIVQGN
jgi:hypothetical protein